MNGKEIERDIAEAGYCRDNKLLEVAHLIQIDGVRHSAHVVRVGRMRNATALKNAAKQQEVTFVVVRIRVANEVEQLK